MRVGLETLIETFLIAVFCIIMTEILASDYQMLQIRNYFYRMQETIEYSQNDPEVLQECVSQAETRGYRLEWEPVDDSNLCIFLSLYYPVPMPEFLNNGEGISAEEGVLQAYARIG